MNRPMTRSQDIKNRCYSSFNITSNVKSCLGTSPLLTRRPLGQSSSPGVLFVPRDNNHTASLYFLGMRQGWRRVHLLTFPRLQLRSSCTPSIHLFLQP